LFVPVLTGKIKLVILQAMLSW